MKYLITLTILSLSLTFSASAKKVKGDVSPIFDISQDDKNLAVSISKDKEAHIYMYSFETNKLTQLTNTPNSYHSRPMFSPDGKKLVFLNKDLSKPKSQIAILDIESGDIEHVGTSVSFVTEAIFHPDGEQIIYCASKHIGNYSPLARKAPHNIDIYSINRDGTQEQKITDYGAYSLSSISIDKKGEKVVFEIMKLDKLEGIYEMALSDTSSIKKIEAVNNPRPGIGASFYGTPYYSNDNSTISFVAPYQVYTLDLESKDCKIAWDNTKDDEMIMAVHSRFMDSDKKLIISGLKIVKRQYTSNALIMIIDLSNGNIEELAIK